MNTRGLAKGLLILLCLGLLVLATGFTGGFRRKSRKTARKKQGFRLENADAARNFQKK